jgi:cell division protein FtsB
VKRLPAILGVSAAFLVLAVLLSIAGQGFAEVARAEQERDQLEAKKRLLERRLDDLQAMAQALRTSTDARESVARQRLGWIKHGERVILLEQPPAPTVPVSLTAPTPTPILSLRDRGDP